GLDIDWEYPQASDQTKAGYLVSLLAKTRKQLDEYTRQHIASGRLLLTVASPAGKKCYSKMQLAAMDQHVDFWNLM
ncbi:hypothetical protein EJ07DRAFT_90094, partial [Lizonia empirigonia]